jgi:hypothetical protein
VLFYKEFHKLAEFLIVLIAISIVFFVLLAFKELLVGNLKKNMCVICGAVVLTWVTLLVLLWLGKFENKVLLALLMGESTLGVFYLVESQVRSNLKLFRLPFLLTLITIAYSVIMMPSDLLDVLIFLSILWILFSLIYFYRGNGKVGTLLKKLVECCKKW